MKKLKKLIVILGFSLGLSGCATKSAPSEARITEKPVHSEASVTEKPEVTEEVPLKKVGFSKDTSVSLKENMSGILLSSKASYTIQDKKYKEKGHIGKLDVHYPVLTGSNKDYKKANQAIYDRLKTELDTFKEDIYTVHIRMDCEVKMATDKIISVLFEGDFNPVGANHPTNASFTVTYDMEEDKVLELTDVADFGDDVLEKAHSAMKSQFTKDLLKEFEIKDTEDVKKQLVSNPEFYLEGNKAYVRVSIMAGAGYHKYVGFDLKDE